MLFKDIAKSEVTFFLKETIIQLTDCLTLGIKKLQVLRVSFGREINILGAKVCPAAVDRSKQA